MCVLDANDSGVAAVVVTYLPVLDELLALLNTLNSQVEMMVLVDNGSGCVFQSWLEIHAPSSLSPIYLETNMGLAAAQNLGIAEARKRGMKYVLLSDQDSLPARDMVRQLLTVAEREGAAGRRFAALGPCLQSASDGSAIPFVRLGKFLKKRITCDQLGQVVEVDHLIASGSLIPIAALNEVGEMNEGLFIDYIDTEWGLRAVRMGYELLGVCDARMSHRLGDQSRRFLGRFIPLHSPNRHYYLFRNAIWLTRKACLPIAWKWATWRRLFMVFVFIMIFGEQRLLRLSMILKGLIDGQVGRMGSYDQR
jgi:rhamnosyltransferase